ncbi:hypothetical protein AVEN_130760-1 [Araneus ventricosus]|uniref:Secreted protein n=1 Tax=Araneus ventricosus TaxID=182803 RepID=A0A4Y2GLZ4_ARAVE|nr:hypothetical protein AVEN_130760-1 [Araneus ventricosus]
MYFALLFLSKICICGGLSNFSLDIAVRRQVELYSSMQDAKKVRLFCARTIGQGIYKSTFTNSARQRERDRGQQRSVSQLTLVKYEPLWLDLQQYSGWYWPSRLSRVRAFPTGLDFPRLQLDAASRCICRPFASH